MPPEPAGIKVVLSRRHDVRAILEHTWLKRRLLAQVRDNSASWATASDLPVPGVLVGVDGRLVIARRFVSTLVDLYGPAQLVDDGPLSSLPSSVTNLIKSAIHRAFLQSDVIRPLEKEASLALEEFEAVASTISTTWPNPQARPELLRSLSITGERLRAALAALPEGIVIP